MNMLLVLPFYNNSISPCRNNIIDIIVIIKLLMLLFFKEIKNKTIKKMLMMYSQKLNMGDRLLIIFGNYFAVSFCNQRLSGTVSLGLMVGTPNCISNQLKVFIKWVFFIWIYVHIFQSNSCSLSARTWWILSNITLDCGFHGCDVFCFIPILLQSLVNYFLNPPPLSMHIFLGCEYLINNKNPIFFGIYMLSVDCTVHIIIPILSLDQSLTLYEARKWICSYCGSILVLKIKIHSTPFIYFLFLFWK